MVPFTAVVVGAWLWWERKRKQRYWLEDAELEAGIERMEAEMIRAGRRQKQVSHTSTWGHLAI